jgi:hypothetical protein
MKRPVRLCILLAGLLAVVLLPAWGGARAEDDGSPADADPAILPLDAVRPGMKGTGYTVKAGTRLEAFEVEVIDVMRNYLPKQDVILVRCLGEAFARHRVAEGMSGSPVYVDGKLIGALAYTWGWSLEPLAGVTPIEAMLAEGERALEGRASGAEPPTHIRRRPPRERTPGDSRDLRPIGTPICVAGFSPEGRAAMSEALSSLGFDVHAAGGGVAAGVPGGWANLDAPMVPGAALVVELLRGDFTAAALGTCTHVRGNKVYGFGHSFNSVGETLFPMSVGYVYTIVSSRNISFKLGSAIRQIGAVQQDRQSGIVGVIGMDAPMVPFHLTMKNAVTGREESFQFEVTPNTLFFQRMMLAALGEAFNKAEGTIGGNTKRYRMEVKLAELDEPWAYEDVIAGFDGGLSRVLIGLVDRVLNHPSQRATFESVKLEIEIENTDRRAAVEAVTASDDDVRRGEEVDLRILLRAREGGDLVVETLRIRVPETVPEGNLVVQVAGGDNVPGDVAAPVDIEDFPDLYAAFYKSTELVAVVPTGRVDLDVDGRLVRNLPLSALPRLARSHEGADTTLRPVTDKFRVDVPYVITGQGQVVLRVLP